jgi:hypothetical protein
LHAAAATQLELFLLVFYHACSLMLRLRLTPPAAAAQSSQQVALSSSPERVAQQEHSAAEAH